jgi:hypothetical protein
MKIMPQPYICDVCQKRRDSDVNHWFVLRVAYAQSGQSQGTELLDIPAPYLEIRSWERNAAESEGAAHACGQEHLQVLIARWLDHRSFEDRAHKVCP